jgi:hypothetical protein
MDILGSNIIKTLVYGDLFDYPLTTNEIIQYLISNTKFSNKVVFKQLKILIDSKQVYTDGEYFFLKNRKKIVNLRKDRGEWAKNKWEIAKRTANKLKVIPTIKMIGITGALAMNNCFEKEDIDLFIITSRNSLWLTRFLIIVANPFLGVKRRKPKDVDVKNKICFNLFLDEKHLEIKPQNLYLAHEIAQVKPVYSKSGVYEKFMKKNQWVKKYLPNIVFSHNLTIQQYNNRSLITKLLNCFIVVGNMFAYFIQRQYMKPKMTIEKVSLNQAFFHPKNQEGRIITRYFEKIKTLGLDKKNK